MIKRRRFRQLVPFQDRLATFAQDARDEAAKLPPGIERDDMLRKASRYSGPSGRLGQHARLAASEVAAPMKDMQAHHAGAWRMPRPDVRLNFPSAVRRRM